MENLIYLLIFVLLPLFEWLRRMQRDRAAEQRRRASPPRPAVRPPPKEPARLPSVPSVAASARTIADRSKPATDRAPVKALSLPRPPMARKGRIFGGRAALRRAVIARTVLGRCRALEPYGSRPG